MPFSPTTRLDALLRAQNRCECLRQCAHHRGQRCNEDLTNGFEAHHRTAEAAGGSDELNNCEALCLTCHKNTGTYGKPR